MVQGGLQFSIANLALLDLGKFRNKRLAVHISCNITIPENHQEPRSDDAAFGLLPPGSKSRKDAFPWAEDALGTVCVVGKGRGLSLGDWAQYRHQQSGQR